MSIRMTPAARPRVFLGLVEIAGYYRGLKKGFDELGVPCTFVDLSWNPFAYEGHDRSGRLLRALRWLARRKSESVRAGRMLEKVACHFGIEALRPLLFAWAATRHDIFVLGFGTSFFHHLEGPVLRWLGKRIVRVYHGSDSRPPYVDGFTMSPDRRADISYCERFTRATKRRVLRADRHAHAIVDGPAAGHFHERPFASFQAIGIPYEAPPRASYPRTGGPIRILHCPSAPHAKGSVEIRALVEKLKAEGRSIDFVEVCGKPNAVVLQELDACDFVIDQMYSDTPMGGFATEAALRGKPAVVGGYFAEFWTEQLSRCAVPSRLFVPPERVAATVAKLVDDRDFRETAGAEARDFVMKHWSSRQVAERFLRLAGGEAPPDWTCDPRDIQYAHGYGLREAESRELVRTLIGRFGVRALRLSDKPELERRFLEFAGGTSGC